MLKRCPSCQSKNQADSLFCTECGATLTNVGASKPRVASSVAAPTPNALTSTQATESGFSLRDGHYCCAKCGCVARHGSKRCKVCKTDFSFRVPRTPNEDRKRRGKVIGAFVGVPLVMVLGGIIAAVVYESQSNSYVSSSTSSHSSIVANTQSAPAPSAIQSPNDGMGVSAPATGTQDGTPSRDCRVALVASGTPDSSYWVWERYIVDNGFLPANEVSDYVEAVANAASGSSICTLDQLGPLLQMSIANHPNDPENALKPVYTLIDADKHEAVGATLAGVDIAKRNDGTYAEGQSIAERMMLGNASVRDLGQRVYNACIDIAGPMDQHRPPNPVVTTNQ